MAMQMWLLRMVITLNGLAVPVLGLRLAEMQEAKAVPHCKEQAVEVLAEKVITILLVVMAGRGPAILPPLLNLVLAHKLVLAGGLGMMEAMEMTTCLVAATAAAAEVVRLPAQVAAATAEFQAAAEEEAVAEQAQRLTLRAAMGHAAK